MLFQDLIQLICDVKSMEEAVVEMKYDAKKAPLGLLGNYACTHAHTHACMHTHMHTHKHTTHTYVHMHTHTHTHTHTTTQQTQTHTHRGTHTHHTHTNTHTGTHMCTQAPSYWRSSDKLLGGLSCVIWCSCFLPFLEGGSCFLLLDFLEFIGIIWHDYLFSYG